MWAWRRFRFRFAHGYVYDDDLVRAFFPGKDFDYDTIREVEDPNWMMILPLVIFAVAMLVFGLHPQPVIQALESVAAVMQ